MPMFFCIMAYFYYAQIYSSLSSRVLPEVLPRDLARDLFKIQRRMIRIITGVHPTASYRNLSKKFNVLIFLSIYICNVLQFVFQNQHKFPHNTSFHKYNTRDKFDIHIPTHRLTVSPKLPSIEGASIAYPTA